MLKTLLNRLGLRKVRHCGKELPPVDNMEFYRFLHADLSRFMVAAEENGKHELVVSCQSVLSLIEQRIGEAKQHPRKFYQDEVLKYVNEGAFLTTH